MGFPAIRACYQNFLCLSSGTKKVETQEIAAFQMHMVPRDGASTRHPETPRRPLCPDCGPEAIQHAVITASRAVPTQKYAQILT